MNSIFLYRVFLGCSLAVDAIAAWFFVIGLADGSVSSSNIGLWLALLAVLSVVFAAARALRARGRTGRAIAVLSVVAVPGLLGGLFVLLILVTQPRWN